MRHTQFYQLGALILNLTLVYLFLLLVRFPLLVCLLVLEEAKFSA